MSILSALGLNQAITDTITKVVPDIAENQKAVLNAEIQALLADQKVNNDGESTQQAATLAAESSTSTLAHFRDAAGWMSVVGMSMGLLREIVSWTSIAVGHPLVLPEFSDEMYANLFNTLMGVGAMHCAPTLITALKGK
jgi:hypothetical protein